MWAMLLGVDVGGTFTDAVLLGQDGRIHTAKAPTTPDDQSVAVLAAVEEVLRRAGALPRHVQRFAHGMTVATNALLEGKTANTALLASEGFTDLIELGRQARPQLYRLCVSPPAPLTPPQRRFGVPERTGPEGVIRPLTPQAATETIAALASCEPEAIAVVLLHSYAHPEHELMLAQSIAAALPDVHVSLSHNLVGTFREYERAATTEIDAALSPLLSRYLARLSQRAGETDLPQPQVMQSSGGLLSCDRAASHAALTVLSGPAGGVGGARMLATMAAEPDLLCLDMGGTSCDVCLISEGAVAETAQRTVAGRPLALPALDIHTVGAGGGSIAWRDAGGALRVGPRSAGADPGPACYGRGGQHPTVTDANMVLGRLLEDHPLAGGVRLSRTASEDAVARLADELGLNVIECAEGIVRIAEAEMLKALRVMSVERGHDPRGFALMGFGGAGPLHVVSLAAELGIQRVLCPRASGVLSALGLAAAAPRRDAARTVMLSGDQLSASRLDAAREELIATASEALGEWPQEIRVCAELRYHGQSFELGVPAPQGTDPEDVCAAFAQAHEQRYGYRDEQAQIELVTLRVSAFGAAPQVCLAPDAGEKPDTQTRELILSGRPVQTRCLLGELPPGTRIEGPALCSMPETTLLVGEGWSGHVDEQGTIVLYTTGGADS
ncbi:MAG TPA: hydantoinase/oxoprolinase family protein [Solirubrobacteraceae bacterium]|jgi:N-methylhydantoinase A|nr:hydantoinase/oxoprolinase family protein [Solirubrobacteraceae bacterium]